MTKFSMEKYTVSQMDAGDHDTCIICEHGGTFNVQLFDDDVNVASELVRRLNELERLRAKVEGIRREISTSLSDVAICEELGDDDLVTFNQNKIHGLRKALSILEGKDD